MYVGQEQKVQVHCWTHRRTFWTGRPLHKHTLWGQRSEVRGYKAVPKAACPAPLHHARLNNQCDLQVPALQAHPSLPSAPGVHGQPEGDTHVTPRGAREQRDTGISLPTTSSSSGDLPDPPLSLPTTTWDTLPHRPPMPHLSKHNLPGPQRAKPGLPKPCSAGPHPAPQTPSGPRNP